MSRTALDPEVLHIEEAARAIEAEFGVALGSEARVIEACGVLRRARASWNHPVAAERLERLARLLPGLTGPLVPPLFQLIEEVAGAAARPWGLLGPMLRAGPRELVERALDRLAAAVDEGRLTPDDDLIASVAAACETGGSPLAERPCVEKLARLLGGTAHLRYLQASDPATRRLAARVLDLRGHPPGARLAAALLGDAAHDFFAPYLRFTRATHLDLLTLATGSQRRCLASLRDAEVACGPALLREVVAASGWAAVTLGLDVRKLVGVSIGGGLPLLLAPEDAKLFDGCPGATRVFERTLIVAHGASPEPPATAGDSDAAIRRFRASNLAHARMLAEFLDLAPLTRERVDRITAGVGSLLADFLALFSDARDECRQLQIAYERITTAIAEAIARAPGSALPADAVRLVQPFEDPPSAEAINTLHGFKRYLHQRGLRLGFRLVRGGRHATRSLSILVAGPDRVTHVARAIEYADFDPDPGSTGDEIPYAVRALADAFGHQLLHGEDKLPSARVFCYGNEVHYFIAFRNHPAFVRIDYSPPFAGGMIDLEYYGVSKYELAHHPNIALDGLRTFFKRLDFEVTIENTRVHARYDKERARDLADLCARAEALFRLAPYLMEIDWVLGHLELSRESREIAARAWADLFARWGVLPIRQLLSADRRAIVRRDEPHPAGARARVWQGGLPYEDRLTPDAEAATAAVTWIRDVLRCDERVAPAALDIADLAQVPFEASVLAPLHDGGRDGARVHEAGALAALIHEGGERLVDAARLARVLTPLDPYLAFETIGSVCDRVVQRTAIVLPGRRISAAVLRDDGGAPGLALAAERGRQIDTGRVAALLRLHNFPVGDVAGPGDPDAGALGFAYMGRGRERPHRHLDGERFTRGVRAAPGVATGIARLGTARRTPRDLAGAVLVSDRLSPEDGPFLAKASAVVCTGGGILTHAGLLAAQFGRPALVIDARWTGPVDATALLQFWPTEYDEIETTVGGCPVVERRGFRRHDEWLRDGDLVEVSADERVMRVFGQDREVLALHDALRQLESSEARLAVATAPERILNERGRRAHAVHQLQRLVSQLARPDLAALVVRRLLTAAATPEVCAGLLGSLLDGPARQTTERCLADQLVVIASRHDDARRVALQRIAVATDAFEVIALRLAVSRSAATVSSTRAVLRATRPEQRFTVPEAFAQVMGEGPGPGVDESAAIRLRALHEATKTELAQVARGKDVAAMRHLLDAVDRGDAALGLPAASAPQVDAARAAVRECDRAAIARCEGHRILTAADGGSELQPLIGSKAANLAEAVRLDPAVVVPAWFAITTRAFEEALDRPAASTGATVRGAIAAVLARKDLDPRQQSRAIATIWEGLDWPAALEADVRAAYRELAAADPGAPRSAEGEALVAVRSSAFEEDTATATRAGEFDTFLFVAGERSLLAHVARAWAGLWTPRAIHNRAALGVGRRLPGGGILIQRIVDARTAGVVQTINVADGRPWEMSVDVAFGLGEGVVSGRVAADHVTVAKRGLPGEALRFRYLTADKRDRIVFDRQRGGGTLRADTLYHQRMRPALEYAELDALVETAGRLERAWREALDIEFAFDAQRLWVLQARPVPAFHAAWRETARACPFSRRDQP